MANTTSGTVTFDKSFAVDEIIAEAYERMVLRMYWKQLLDRIELKQLSLILR
jgi:hypothetical protein